jgi:diaminopimelate decarboxylase/aspartate kinase
VGSGIVDAEAWTEIATTLAGLADAFPDVRGLNVGGGLGVAAHAEADALDVDALAEGLDAFKRAHPDRALWMAPGRFLVAEAGVLLARVTQRKRKADGHAYVGVETGMNSLIRPALYGAYHEIANLSRLNDPPALTAEVVGPICESGDVLGRSRRLPKTEEGDVLLIAQAGAYGHAMASHYNLRPPASERMLDSESTLEA